MPSTPAGQRGVASSFWYFSRYLASVIGIVIFEAIFDLWIRSDEPRGITGAIHLFHPIPDLEIGFDHAFIVGILFIVGMIILTVLLQEGRDSDFRRYFGESYRHVTERY